MWSGMRLSATIDRRFESSVIELLQFTTRVLILVTASVYLMGYFLVRESLSTPLHMRLFFVTVVVVASSMAAWWLVERQLVIAQGIWQTGLLTAITLAVALSGKPEIAFFYALLPLIVTVTIGWWAGLLTEGIVVTMLWWLAHGPIMLPLSLDQILVIAASGAIGWAVGWASTHSLLTVVGWSLFSYEQARQKMEETRERQVELKQVQEDLIQANRQLSALSDRLKAMQRVAEEARQAKADFVARVSHELRTPLNMIIGFSDLITQSPEVYGERLPAALLADIAAIRRNSQHLAQLIDDVLDLSQVDAGRMALSKEWTSLPNVVKDAAEAVSLLFRSKGLSLEIDVSSDIPLVYCDSTRIRQVLINLLSNAGRFTERGGVLIKVRREDKYVVVSVTDTGPGISAADQAKLFEPFEQLDGSVRRRHGGSGLGLSISKRFVEMHEGRMWLESQVGVGTTIYFSLPLEPPAPLESDARRWFNPYEGPFEARTRRSKAPVVKPLPRFLIVEKGQTLQHLFARYMSGIEVVALSDVEHAIKELSQAPAQALIMNTPLAHDTIMSSNQLANLPYGTPAITCWVPGKDETARRLGVVEYLVKPITRDVLLSTLASMDEVETILLVDDEREVLRLFSRMLATGERKYRILWATSGQRALTLLRERRPDLVLLDLIMPGMDGFQVLQEKSKDPTICDIPVIVISSRDPSGEPIVSDRLTVARSGGLAVSDLLTCIRVLSEILSPRAEPADQGRPEKSPV